jgi:putative flippase GtrA
MLYFTDQCSYDTINYMKRFDVIFTFACAAALSFLMSDFLHGGKFSLGLLGVLVIWVVLSAVLLTGLWLAELIGTKYLSVFQAAKHLLVGAFATALDLKIFELLAVVIFGSVLAVKAVSFLVSTTIKYLGNKFWVFQKQGKENIKSEGVQFLIVTLIGLVIDILAFYYATKVLGPRFEIPSVLWVKCSVIFAAIAAACWNFLGYKFIVFKK